MEKTVDNHVVLQALCVDDDEAVHELLQMYIDQGCEFSFATNGSGCMSLAENRLYDVIFLDINLGRDTMDGLALLQHLRAIPGYQDVPVVALTAFAMIGDKEEFMQAGCNYYISKPFNRENLLQVVSLIQKEKLANG